MAKAKLRAIDRGTRYDVTGNLRRFVRRIESGDLQDATDVLVIARCHRPPDGRKRVEIHHFGSATIEEMHWMVSTAKNRYEPA